VTRIGVQREVTTGTAMLLIAGVSLRYVFRKESREVGVEPKKMFVKKRDEMVTETEEDNKKVGLKGAHKP
jgi:hypothetical protein